MWCGMIPGVKVSLTVFFCLDRLCLYGKEGQYRTLWCNGMHIMAVSVFVHVSVVNFNPVDCYWL